jgi:branched-chain amino acid transport system substrate-binding protein
VGSSAVGLVSTANWSPDLENAVNRSFVSAYRTRFGREPTSYSAQGYDTARLVVQAVKQAGPGASTSELRRAIRQPDFASVRGNFRFGPTQFPIQDWYALEVVAGPSGLTNRIVSKVLVDHGPA